MERIQSFLFFVVYDFVRVNGVLRLEYQPRLQRVREHLHASLRLLESQ